ncbi:MAG: hypothetical protein ACR2RF_13880, partial [Geminicoccaceae bacterium]
LRVPLSDGQEVELTAADVRDSLMMRADYTSKTQELADQRRQLEQERLAVQNLTASLAAMKDGGGVPPMPPAEMLQDDPVGYLSAERAHKDAKENLEAAQRAAGAAQAEQTARWKDENDRRVLELIPEWKDHTRQSSEMAALRNHLVTNVGFTAQEFDESFGKALVHSGVAKLARDSLVLHQALAKRNGTGNGTGAKRVVKKPVNVSGQPAASGSSTEARLQKGVDKALKDLQQRRSIDPLQDAVAHVEARMALARGAKRRA